MTTNGDKQALIEILKGHRVIDFQTFEDTKHEEIRSFKKQFKRDWNSNHEKVEKQMEEKVKQIHALGEEWLELAYPEEKSIWKKNVSIKIVIIEEE